MDLSNEVENVFGTILSWIPEILAALLVLIIGYLVAIALKSATLALLKKFNLNKQISENKRGNWVTKVVDNPAKFVASVVYWLVWIVVITIAIPILNIPFLNQLVYDFYAYIPNILASIVILGVAIFLSTIIDKYVDKLMGDTPTGRIVMVAAPAVIMTIAVFMILVQLGIATSIVVITYAAIIGALALGFALAFGLGGRGVASSILEDAYRKGKEGYRRARSDVEKAKGRYSKE